MRQGEGAHSWGELPLRTKFLRRPGQRGARRLRRCWPSRLRKGLGDWQGRRIPYGTTRQRPRGIEWSCGQCLGLKLVGRCWRDEVSSPCIVGDQILVPIDLSSYHRLIAYPKRMLGSPTHDSHVGGKAASVGE